MFTELVSQFSSSGSSSVTPSKGEFYLITESHDVDGSFLIHHFLSQYLKGGFRIVFLGLAQSFSHYSAVAQKLGLNLVSAKSSGQLVFINGLNFSFPFVGRSSGIDGDEILSRCMSTNSLQPLYASLREHLEIKTGEQTQPSTLLLIDDITILNSLGVNTRQIFDFIQYCQVSLQGQGPEPCGSVVTLLHCDSTEDEDEDVVLLSNRLQHACTCHLKVEGLSSGFCRDVHGQMTIVQRSSSKSDPRTSKKMLQFKIMDKNVSFFASGTSSAVL